MPRLATAFALFCTLFAAALTPTRSSAAAPAPHMVNVMVQLKGSALADDSQFKAKTFATRYRMRLDPTLPAARWYASALQRYQSQEVNFLKQHGVDLTVQHSYHLLLNGFTAAVRSDQLNKLTALTNVVSVSPVRKPIMELDKSVQLVQGPEAWSMLGGAPNAGKGLIVADIDSGIDITNPCFKDTGFQAPAQYGGHPRSDNKENAKLTNNKVIVARAFGPQDGKSYSAADQEGHGTFTASVETCDYNTPTPLGTRISGVAPAAYVLNYNIFPKGTETANFDPVPRALEAALLDGADVVNMSIGFPLGGGDSRLDPDIAAVNAAIKAGITVVVSAGNVGPTPQSVTSPASAQDAIAVGATTNSRGVSASLTVSDSSAAVPQNLTRVSAKEGSHAFTQMVGPAQVVYAGYGRKPNDDPKAASLDEFAGKDFHGKIALIQRGSDTGSPILFETKINNAAKAGAIAAIVFDNHAELNLISMDVKTANLPAMFVSQADGKALLDWIQNHPSSQLTLDPRLTTYPETPNILADFSSRGFGAGYAIKPDLVAPGQDIYAATESEVVNNSMYDPRGFTIQEGTSFSAPHVAGAVALVLQKHPTWSPAVVKAVLMNNASPNVSLSPDSPGKPSIVGVGAGELDVASAVDTPAYLMPASLSFSELNTGNGNVQQTQQLSLTNTGTGTGIWTAGVQQIHSSTGLQITVPSTVSLSATTAVTIPVQVSATGAAAAGLYDGYITLTKDGRTLHVPYLIHVATQAVKPGSVLLVDVTQSLYQPDPPSAPIPRFDVSHYFTDTLTKLGKSYTYWDESKQGVPSLQDMKAAAAVVYFTGKNLNLWQPPNSDPQDLIPPIDSPDIEVLHSYLDAGGHLLMTGMGAALTDFDFTAILLGATQDSFSVYDNSNNDQQHKGGISPPRPSAVADTGVGPFKKVGIFAGLKAIDFSTQGDGAKDNTAVYLGIPVDNSDPSGTLVGVTGLSSLKGNFGFQGSAHGQPALKTTQPGLSTGGTDVAVVSSDEPSFNHKPSYKGRSVLMSFGFEGINDNTGFATREQVLQRVLTWFNDTPAASVSTTQYRAHQRVQLRATLKGGQKAAAYQWQIGNTTLKVSGSPTTYTFPRAGKYRARVTITDVLGHVAVSPWATLTVR